MKAAANTPHNWSEDKLQAELFMWFHNKFPMYRGLLYAVPNGGERNGLQAKILKATGTWPGVADLHFIFDNNIYMIELKRPDGKGVHSPAQKAWQAQVQSQGIKYVVFNDLLEAKKFILECMIDWTEDLHKPHKQLNLF